jgi:Calx-beta domain
MQISLLLILFKFKNRMKTFTTTPFHAAFGAHIRAMLLLFLLPLSISALFGQVTATEEFENETVGAGVFSESGINFTFNNGTTAIQKFDIISLSPFGYAGSAKFLEMYSIGSNSTATGTISINATTNPGIGFKINSFAAYTAGGGSGSPMYNGLLRVYGTPMGGGASVTTTIAISSNGGPLLSGQSRDANGIVSGINFTGTALDGLFFTSLSFEIIDTDIPSGLIGTRYIELDHINFTTSIATTNTYALGNVNYTEGNSGSATYAYTITRSVSAAAGTVQIQSSGGTATAGTDYVAVPLTTVSFPIGSLTQTVNVTINGDVTIEPNETFNMVLSNPTVGTIGTGTGVVTIVNDDSFAETFEDETTLATVFTEGGVDFRSTDKLKVFKGTATAGNGLGAGGSNGVLTSTAPFATGAQGSIEVTSGGKSISMLSVDLWSSLVTGNSYPATNCTVTFVGTKADGTGTVTHSANITPTGTNVYTTVSFAGTPFNNIPIIAISFSVSGTVNYLNIDNFNFAPIPVTSTQVSINDVSVVEGTGGGTTTAIFTISRTNNTSAFSVNVASSNSTATAGSDYTTFPTTTLNFTNGGALSQTVSVTVLRDAIVETTETFNMTLSSATNGTVYLKQIGIGTIYDDDGGCEDFEGETVNATSFSQSGILFNTTSSYKIAGTPGATIGSGAGSSAFFLLSGTATATGNASYLSIGKLTIATANTAFKLQSIDAWVGTSSNSFSSGSVKFTGTLVGGATVSTIKTVTATSNSGTGWQQGITFMHTPRQCAID